MMEYMMSVKGITPSRISLYQPTKQMLMFMERNYGLSKRLEDAKFVYTYFDILSLDEKNLELYKKNENFQEEERKKPDILEYGIISNAGKTIVQSTSNLLAKTKRTQILNNELVKSAMFKKNQNLTPIPVYKNGIHKNKRSIYVKESLDEILKPIVKQEMKHNSDDLSQYYSAFVTKPPEDPLPSFMKRYDQEDTMRKIIFGDSQLYLGFSSKKRNELAQSLKFPTGLKTDLYKGEDLSDPLYYKSTLATSRNSDRYNNIREYSDSRREVLDKISSPKTRNTSSIFGLQRSSYD